MKQAIIHNRKTFAARAIMILFAVGAAVALPQVFHAIGVLSGTGSAVGAALLPMHLPVLLAGFLGGPVTGMITGILSPLVSSGISGMPAAEVLPFMVIELGTYGLVSGLLSGTQLHRFAQLIVTQIAGRAARALAVLAAIYVLGNTRLTLASIAAFVLEGLFGILLQWAVIPLLTDKRKGLLKYYD